MFENCLGRLHWRCESVTGSHYTEPRLFLGIPCHLPFLLFFFLFLSFFLLSKDRLSSCEAVGVEVTLNFESLKLQKDEMLDADW